MFLKHSRMIFHHIDRVVARDQSHGVSQMIIIKNIFQLSRLDIAGRHSGLTACNKHQEAHTHHGFQYCLLHQHLFISF